MYLHNAHNKKLTHIKELICEAVNMYIEVLLYNVDILYIYQSLHLEEIIYRGIDIFVCIL